jgi:hypothetical protein
MPVNVRHESLALATRRAACGCSGRPGGNQIELSVAECSANAASASGDGCPQPRQNGCPAGSAQTWCPSSLSRSGPAAATWRQSHRLVMWRSWVFDMEVEVHLLRVPVRPNQEARGSAPDGHRSAPSASRTLCHVSSRTPARRACRPRRHSPKPSRPHQTPPHCVPAS